MTKRSINDYLQDILDIIAAVEQFTEDIEFEEFSQNLEKIFAVSRAFEIIREAVKIFLIQLGQGILTFRREILLE